MYDLFIRVIKAGSSPSALTEGFTDSINTCRENQCYWFLMLRLAGWYAGSNCRRDFIPVICRLAELDATSAPNLRGSCSGSLDQRSDESHYNFILGESHALQPTAAWPTLDVTKPVKAQMGIKELTEDSSGVQMWDAEKWLILNTKWCPALFLRDASRQQQPRLSYNKS